MTLLNPRRSEASGEVTLADRVFEWLAEQIVVGNIRPGQWISENEVAARLGISRSPVRDALRSFAREGLVEVRRRRGTIMAELNADEADDLYRTRTLIEPEMARLAVEHMTDEQVQQVAQITEELRDTIGDPTAFYDSLLQLYQLMMDACPSQSLRDIVAMLWRRTMRFRGITLRIPTWKPQKETLAFAERFVKAARGRDPEAAHAALAELLEKTRQSLLEQLFIEVSGGGRVPRSLAGQGASQPS